MSEVPLYRGPRGGWLQMPEVPCEDRVLDGPASGEKGSKGRPYKYCDPRT
jgi:hypothetical protein